MQEVAQTTPPHPLSQDYSDLMLYARALAKQGGVHLLCTRREKKIGNVQYFAELWMTKKTSI